MWPTFAVITQSLQLQSVFVGFSVLLNIIKKVIFLTNIVIAIWIVIGSIDRYYK